MSDYRHLVIQAVAPQDSDYEVYTDMAVQNTLLEYWQWAEESGISDMRFEVVYSEKQGCYSSLMEVFALFEYKRSLAEFKLCHMWTLPKTKLGAGLDHKVLYT
jgi:hypothetical protein